MRETSILIVHPDRKAQRIVQRILGASGYRIDAADDLAHAAVLVGKAAPRLVVIDASVMETPSGSQFIADLAARGTEACMTLIGSRAYSEIPRLVATGAITNMLVHPMPVLAEELIVTVHKLLRGDLFGAEKYLLWGTELQAETVTRSSQRARLIEALSAAVRNRGQSDRVASMAMLVADELISNAVHNAPVDERGVHYRKDLPRDTELELDDRHQVYLRWGCDARYLAIEVRDSFGSLDRDRILEAIGSNNVREHGGGAGMGISLAYRSCDHLVFNLAPGKCTEIIALIDVRRSPGEGVPASSYNVFVERA